MLWELLHFVDRSFSSTASPLLQRELVCAEVLLPGVLRLKSQAQSAGLLLA